MQDGTPIASIDDIVKLTEGPRRIFRGERSCKNPLLPGVGRNTTLTSTELAILERRTLTEFRRSASPYFPRNDYADWQWMAMAQHHGLRTRLLDWTRNVLVALYFAVDRDCEDDGVVYAFEAQPGEKLILPTDDPFNPGGNFWFLPDHVTPRIAAQRGVFSIQPDPLVEFDRPALVKHLVPAAKRPALRSLLNRWGFDSSTLFPGPEGLSQLLNLNFTLKENGR